MNALSVQSAENHADTTPGMLWTSRHEKTTYQLPLLISKKWLCAHFGVTRQSLYRLVLTDSVLTKAGLSAADVRRPSCKTFDRETSALLIQGLGLG